MLLALVPTVALPLSANPSTLGEQSLGTIVTIEVDGVLTEFIVVQQGSPSSVYSDFEDGTVLLMRGIWDAWLENPRNANYSANTLHLWLNDEFYNMIEPAARNAVRNVGIPTRLNQQVRAYIFAPSVYELNNNVPIGNAQQPRSLEPWWDAVAFEYFVGALGHARAAQASNGTYWAYWTRTTAHNRNTDADVGMYFVDSSGSSVVNTNIWTSYSVRPALVFADTVQVGADGRLLFGAVPPVEPPTDEPTDDDDKEPHESAFTPELAERLNNSLEMLNLIIIFGIAVFVGFVLYKLIAIFV